MPGLKAAVEEAARASDLETLKVKQATEARWKNVMHQVTQERRAHKEAAEGRDVLKAELVDVSRRAGHHEGEPPPPPRLRVPPPPFPAYPHCSPASSRPS